MTGRVVIAHEGIAHDPFTPGKAWAGLASQWSETEAEHYRRVIVDGTMLQPNGELMPEAKAKRIRASLLGTYSGRPGVSDPSGIEAGREYIPGLWRFGTIPMLGGPPKVGKSTLVAELAAALIIPGRRFLESFDPIELTEDERARDVWLINAENPPGELHEALLETGLLFDNLSGAVPFYFHPEGGGALIVEHLEDLGGAGTFDLTVPENREWWEFRFMQCPCTGVNDAEPPLTVIADGVTAMLGTKTERYGEWYGPFRELLHYLDVPNGLAVGHNGLAGKHLMNGVESMAGPDGLWTYYSPNPDEPNSPRYFWTVPRLRAPKVEKSRMLMENGRLTLRRREPGPPAEPVASEDPSQTSDTTVLAALRRAGSAGLLTTEVTGRGRVGTAKRDAMNRLKENGLIHSRPEGTGTRWFLAVIA